MKAASDAILLRIFIGESDKHDGRAMYTYLVEYLRKNHFAGVTVLRGIEGYGHASKVHTADILDLSTDLPIVIEVVENVEKIEALKTMLNHLDNEARMLVTEEKVKVIRYGNNNIRRELFMVQ